MDKTRTIPVPRAYTARATQSSDRRAGTSNAATLRAASEETMADPASQAIASRETHDPIGHSGLSEKPW